METWKPVCGFEGIYEVSDLGRVRRVAGWADGRSMPLKECFTLGGKARYARVALQNRALKKKRRFPVHRLVMAAFVGPITVGHEVNHINGDKRDNRLHNLEYVTHSENQYHLYRVLHQPSRPGSKHHNAKITEVEVLAIRALKKCGWTISSLAQRFGVSQANISLIAARKAWKHV